MRWFPNLATAAFCETIELRKKISQRQSGGNSSVSQGLEPSNTEFIAALAAGNNSHNILQVGCGISTVALAVAAQTTGGFLVSIHVDESKQDIVRYHMNYLGLLEYVEFVAAGEPSQILLTRTNIDFAHLSGDPKDYIQLFDSLNLSHGAIVAAENALSAASNAYIQHVRRQPGIESSTLPFAKGLEVTKVASWEKFETGRIFFSGICKGVLKDIEQGTSSNPYSCQRQPSVLPFLPKDVDSTKTITQNILSCNENALSTGSTTGNFQEPWFRAHPSESTTSAVESITPANVSAKVISRSMSSFADYPSVAGRNPANKGNEDSSAFKVSFRNHRAETQVTITGVNRDMLLSDITAAFSEMGISVKTAKIDTCNEFVEDIFHVIDAKSRTPIHPSQWSLVKEKILGSIAKRGLNRSM